MSKETIKKILREGKEVNAMGSAISRPNQELIIMRGIPGSGKSTESKKRVGNGVIHSTDEVIEAQYNYREFFSNMIANKDFAPLSKAHSENFKNAVASMKGGKSPVIIDNTNIKADEAKNYVEAALKMGYDGKNISFVEVGTGGQSAESLADRNTHGVPLDKIKQMIQAYNSVGPMTLEKVLGAKSRFGNKQRKIAMVVLDDASKKKLLTAIGSQIPEGWKIYAHHMTVNFGKGLPEDLKGDLGTSVSIRATAVGMSDKAMAVKVEGYHSDNDLPHVTVAVNIDEGGKPKDSNLINQWSPLGSHINISGIVTEEVLQ